jgi:uncharacterized protein (TIGR02145 family)
MKTLNLFLGLLTLFNLIGCKKEEPVKLRDVSATAATNITSGSATLNGTVNADNKLTFITFEYGISADSFYSITGYPYLATGDTLTHVSADIWSLLPGSTYQFRLKAVNSIDTVYSNDVRFTTQEIKSIVFNPDLSYGSVSDVDGNTYKTIQIGTQTWMAENLKTTKYNDGLAIPNVKDNTEWGNSTTGAYCDYSNFPAYSAIYGRLYNWFAIAYNNSENACPAGWHIPSDSEWTVLIDYLGGSDLAGGKLREAGSSHWPEPNSESTNESGFTALPGGGRYEPSTFGDLGSHANWWSSAEENVSNGKHFHISFYGTYIDSASSSKQGGLSVRCIKN